jgi:hypothetical protein
MISQAIIFDLCKENRLLLSIRNDQAVDRDRIWEDSDDIGGSLQWGNRENEGGILQSIVQKFGIGAIITRFK